MYLCRTKHIYVFIVEALIVILATLIAGTNFEWFFQNLQKRKGFFVFNFIIIIYLFPYFLQVIFLQLASQKHKKYKKVDVLSKKSRHFIVLDRYVNLCQSL